MCALLACAYAHLCVRVYACVVVKCEMCVCACVRAPSGTMAYGVDHINQLIKAYHWPTPAPTRAHATPDAGRANHARLQLVVLGLKKRHFDWSRARFSVCAKNFAKNFPQSRFSDNFVFSVPQTM